jgi:hypothetical protein
MGRGQGQATAIASELLYGQRTSRRRLAQRVEQAAEQDRLAAQRAEYGFSDADVPSLQVLLGADGRSLGPLHHDEAIADRIALITAAIDSGQQTFFCVGPSGYGKTLLTTQIAAQAGAPLIRIDDALDEQFAHIITINGHTRLVLLTDQQTEQLRQALSSPLTTVIGTATEQMGLRLALTQLGEAKEQVLIDNEPITIAGKNIFMIEARPHQPRILDTVLAGATPISFLIAPDLSGATTEPAQPTALNTEPAADRPALLDQLPSLTIAFRSPAVTALQRLLAEHEPRFSTVDGQAVAERLIEQLEQLVYSGDNGAVHKILAGIQLALPGSANNDVQQLFVSEEIDDVLRYAAVVAGDAKAARQAGR